MYTTPLGILSSSLSLSQHLYADDTQLFFSVHPRNFDSRPTSRPLCNLFPHGCPQIFLLLTLLRLNFSLLVSAGSFLKYTALHSILRIVHTKPWFCYKHLTFSDQISSLTLLYRKWCWWCAVMKAWEEETRDRERRVWRRCWWNIHQKKAVLMKNRLNVRFGNRLRALMFQYHSPTRPYVFKYTQVCDAW